MLLALREGPIRSVHQDQRKMAKNNAAQRDGSKSQGMPAWVIDHCVETLGLEERPQLSQRAQHAGTKRL